MNGAIEVVLGQTNKNAVVSYSGPASTNVALNTGQPGKTGVVDLTEPDNKSEEDLQRAIALSLQDGGLVGSNVSSTSSTGVSGVSQEEQDVSKALEASLLESSQVMKKKDSQNPHDRQRDGVWPVGLKNVGQTCWFSAVIQSLFHIPAFRNLVIHYTPPDTDLTTDKRKKILSFMSELRKMFSLLLKSQRKYVDPSKAVGILKGTLGGNDKTQGVSNQQDVSEFTHKLLDWLEEAFNVSVMKPKQCDNVNQDIQSEAEPMDSECEKMDREKEHESPAPPAESSVNQMNSLFYGKVEIEGRNNGIDFKRTEQFGQWPLQVNGFKDIHQSLEASMAYQSIDGGQCSGGSGQERWFTTLPPVLFLELSRFHFNTSKGVAEKINNALEFPQNIFLDRYLEVNKNLVRKKREEVRKLERRRESLNQQLDCYLQYGQSSDNSEPSQSQHQHHPLANILRSALQFARSSSPDTETHGEACDQDAGQMQVDNSPCPSPATLTPAQSVSNLGEQEAAVTSVEADTSTDQMMEVETETDPSGDVPAAVSAPRPKFVSELELKVLSSCLGRWIQEVEEEISKLRSLLQEIEETITRMYEEDGLKRCEYRLHAVMVHEGDVHQGHYWAYVKLDDEAGLSWVKFNDNTVQKTTWEDIIKEAAGGRSSTSAYSCVYVNVSKSDLFADVSCPLLPTDLDAFVMEDNKSFAAEIVKYDEEQERMKEAGESEVAQSTQTVLIGDDPECQIIEQKPDLAQSHALLAKDFSKEFFILVINEREKPDTSNTKSKGNLSNIINKIFQAVKAKVSSARAEGYDSADIRLETFLHYLLANDLTIEHYKRALLEQVNLQEFETSLGLGDIGKEVYRGARETLRQASAVERELESWHRAYHQYRIAVHYFVLGVEKYTDNSVEEALELLTVSYIVNEKIVEDSPPNKESSSQSKVISYPLCICSSC